MHKGASAGGLQACARLSSCISSLRQKRGQCSEQHRSIKNLIAMFVEKRLYVAAKISRGAGMHRNIRIVIGVSTVGIRFADLCNEWILPHEIRRASIIAWASELTTSSESFLLA